MPTRRALLAVLLVPALALADKPAVAELFEDDADALIPLLTMGGIGGGEDVKVSAETTDVFTGKAALRVAPPQRFNRDVKDWDFPIAETPKAGEYRYLRFAWKKPGGGSLMLQFHTRKPGQDWYIRYHMGGPPPWESKVLGPAAPADWVVVTRDLFKDFGAVTLGGVAFSPLDGEGALYDHMLLGRTVADLDAATAAALLKAPSRHLGEERLKQLWADLGSSDEIVGETARWAFVAGRKDAEPFLYKTARIPERGAPKPVDAAVVKPLIADLTHYRHLTREAAVGELFRLGDGVLPHLRKAAEAAEGDAKARLAAVLDRWAARAGSDDVRLRRCVPLLRAVGTPEAKEFAAKIEKAFP